MPSAKPLETNNQKNMLLKASTNELKQATFIVMVPDEPDLHGDITSKEDVAKACHNFNLFCRTPNLFHLGATDSFDFVESYVMPTDMQWGDYLVKAGTWVAVIQAYSDEIWDAIKSGEIQGLSIGALATVEDLDD